MLSSSKVPITISHYQPLAPGDEYIHSYTNDAIAILDIKARTLSVYDGNNFSLLWNMVVRMLPFNLVENFMVLSKHAVLVTMVSHESSENPNRKNYLCYQEPGKEPNEKLTSIDYTRKPPGGHYDRNLWRLKANLIVAPAPESNAVNRVFNVYQLSKSADRIVGYFEDISDIGTEVMDCFLVDDQTIAIVLAEYNKPLILQLFRWIEGQDKLQPLPAIFLAGMYALDSYFYLAAQKRLYCHSKQFIDKAFEDCITVYNYDGTAFQRTRQKGLAESLNRDMKLKSVYMTADGETRLVFANMSCPEAAIYILDAESLQVHKKIGSQGRVYTLLKGSGANIRLFDRQAFTWSKSLAFLNLSPNAPSLPMEVLMSVLPAFSTDLVWMVQNYLFLQLVADTFTIVPMPKSVTAEAKLDTESKSKAASSVSRQGLPFFDDKSTFFNEGTSTGLAVQKSSLVKHRSF